MVAVSAEVQGHIRNRLAAVEAEEGVRVLVAVESGSRAWGFASADSDYDVRFVYVRPAAWYLAIDLERRRDVIERPITDLIDLSGWDIRKALALFARSNPPLLEWLDSPVVYADWGGFAGRLRGLLPTYFSPVRTVYHYLHMARGNFREYLQGDRVRLKKYFYVLRPLLAARWVEQGRGPVPMLFSTLLDTVGVDPPLRAAVDDLLARKAAGGEMGHGPRVPAVHDFIVGELDRLESAAGGQPKGSNDPGPLSALFVECLVKAWGDSLTAA